MDCLIPNEETVYQIYLNLDLMPIKLREVNLGEFVFTSDLMQWKNNKYLLPYLSDDMHTLTFGAGSWHVEHNKESKISKF